MMPTPFNTAPPKPKLGFWKTLWALVVFVAVIAGSVAFIAAMVGLLWRVFRWTAGL